MKQIVVTEQHLDRALEERKSGKYISEVCILSQAGKDAFPGYFISTGSRTMDVADQDMQDGHTYTFSDNGYRLRYTFDLHLYDEVREMLPMVVTLTEVRS